MSDPLDRIIQHGNRPYMRESRDNWLHCADGFTVSVIAGYGTYSQPSWLDTPPRQDVEGPFTHVEVGFPSETPQPYSEWEQYAETPDDPTASVYGQVPVELVRALVDSHGGITSITSISPTGRRPGNAYL